MDKPRPPGRPPLPPEQARTVSVMIRLTPAERQAYKDAGGAKWVREMLAERQLFLSTEWAYRKIDTSL